MPRNPFSRRRIAASALVFSLTVVGPAVANPTPADPPSAALDPAPADPPSAALDPAPRGSATDALIDAIELPELRALVIEALDRSPEVARARQHAAAMAARAPQVRALPDPVAALTVFVLPPETRVGPQRLSASVQQKLPWFGKLALAEQAALYAAAAAQAQVETARLDLVTEIRKLYYELAFHEAHEQVVRSERGALARYEKAAQARYAAGTGLQQESIRIQAQITRVDTRLMEIAEHHAMLLATLNALRDRPAGTPIEISALPAPEAAAFDRDELRRLALARRPELAAAEARIAARGSMIALAEKNFRPDLTLGLAYTLVDRRDDVVVPPPDDGDDVLALTGAINLPVRRRRLAAGVEEAHAARRVAEEEKRQVLTGIERSIGDLAIRIPLLYDHWKLLETVLRTQAREGLRSAETAYSLGNLNAVDLLDAEVVLLEVRIAAERTRADLAAARAELERAVVHPLTPSPETPHHD